MSRTISLLEVEMRGPLELSEEQAEMLLTHMAKTDAENAAMSVSGPEVAQYNIRVLRLKSLRKQLEHLEAEHTAHPVTQKIAAYKTKQRR